MYYGFLKFFHNFIVNINFDTYFVKICKKFQNAKRDEHSRRAYKLLATLHSDCNDIVTYIRETAALVREISDIQEQVPLNIVLFSDLFLVTNFSFLATELKIFWFYLLPLLFLVKILNSWWSSPLIVNCGIFKFLCPLYIVMSNIYKYIVLFLKILNTK